MTTPLRVQRLLPTAALPKRGSDRAAGYDLAACLIDETGMWREGIPDPAPNAGPVLRIEPGQRILVPTGIAFTTPPETYGRVAPRSGLAVKQGVNVLAGVIDEDYTGEVRVALINFGQHPVDIAHGDRIAQLVLEKIATPDVEEVESLTETARGVGGFGSTGVN